MYKFQYYVSLCNNNGHERQFHEISIKYKNKTIYLLTQDFDNKKMFSCLFALEMYEKKNPSFRFKDKANIPFANCFFLKNLQS